MNTERERERKEKVRESLIRCNLWQRSSQTLQTRRLHNWWHRRSFGSLGMPWSCVVRLRRSNSLRHQRVQDKKNDLPSDPFLLQPQGYSVREQCRLTLFPFVFSWSPQVCPNELGVQTSHPGAVSALNRPQIFLDRCGTSGLLCCTHP